jgi:hypothetical protein
MVYKRSLGICGHRELGTIRNWAKQDFSLLCELIVYTGFPTDKVAQVWGKLVVFVAGGKRGCTMQFMF